MEEKKYYYFKLQNDFFGNKEIKKLRKIPGGDVYTVIYLKMILASLETNGILFFEGFEDSFAEEVAMALSENDSAVKITVAYLETHNLLVQTEKDEYLLVNVQEKIKNLSQSAIRKSRQRDRENQLKILEMMKSTGQSHANVTHVSRSCHGQVTASHGHVTASHGHVTACHEISDQELDQKSDQNLDLDPSINQDTVSQYGMNDLLIEITNEMVKNHGIPYNYSTSVDVMTQAIHILTDWGEMMDCEENWYGHDDYQSVYVMLNEALIDMCTAQEVRKYGDSPAVTYAKVIDKLNQCVVLYRNDTRITISHFIHSFLDLLVSALVKYDVKKPYPYVRAFIWSYLSSYKLRGAIEKAKTEDGYYSRIRYHEAEG